MLRIATRADKEAAEAEAPIDARWTALVGVAALSGPVRPESLDAGVAALERFGYRVRVARNVLETEPLLGLAGGDEARVSGYVELVADPEVEAVLFARGGYGVTRVLHRLPERLLAETAKLHCGFSDQAHLTRTFKARLGVTPGAFRAAHLA